MIRVFIVAAPLRSRRELTALLDYAPDVEVVGTASSLEGAEDWEELDVLLIRDSSDSADELFDVLEDCGLVRQPPVLLLLEQATQNKVNRAIHLGIRGVLPTDVAAVQLISAVVAVARAWWSCSLANWPSRQLQPEPGTARPPNYSSHSLHAKRKFWKCWPAAWATSKSQPT